MSDKSFVVKSNHRLIARLDIKVPNLIKGINLEGLRVLGDPAKFASKYYRDGIDELIYMDSVATLYGRNHLEEFVSRTADSIFVPLTVGGGIRTVDDVDRLLRAGADKVAINSAAVLRPELIGEVANRFGSQCMVLSIEAKSVGDQRWEVYIENGREKSGRDVLDWVAYAQSLGAGEILLTSIDREGTQKGFDLGLCRAVSRVAEIPIIISGGMGKDSHMVDAFKDGNVDAIAMAHVLHYNLYDIPHLRDIALKAGCALREC